ncbi:MAG: hypothetical protein KKG47_01655 [Proteobacteria bacterium]|nr:hypothetical protein [Pseudomonadota bacterium]MBU1738318.1 hypothetical protein [Pseudomonadota bacterium]
MQKPAAPEYAQERCGDCHLRTHETLESLHFTARNMVNMVRRHFGAARDLGSASEIPVKDSPENILELTDDLLRRNCLSCHLNSGGDAYPGVIRGTGCASCHLEFRDGALLSHHFVRKPADTACLSCHYGNRVGSDYYGWFEHDFKHEYRTPYQIDGSYPPRPYGVEQHRLAPDVHQRAGMTCIDCHPGRQLMGESPGISCIDCHRWQKDDRTAAQNLETNELGLTLKLAHEQRQLQVPPATDTRHKDYNDTADCQVCHAQWSYMDRSTHLLRLDAENYEDWADLVVQSSYEAELLLSNSIYGEESYPPAMTDKLTGIEKPGLWLKGYDTRRWETPFVTTDSSGKFQIARPILDLVLSWVDSNGETVFDSVRGNGKEFRTYTPHTTGPAGIFYRQRLTDMATPKKNGAEQKK